MGWRKIVACAGVAAFASVAARPASADAVEDFYKKNDIKFVIGIAVGGSYDTSGRLLARHIGKYIPGNPKVQIQNMPGASSRVAANYIYAVAPKDGSAIGMFASSTAFEQMFGGEGVQFDTAKFTWIGNMDASVGTCGVWNTSGIDSFDELMAKPSVFGGSGPSAVTSQHAVALKKLMGAKIKLVEGYTGAGDIKLAMARGELGGSCGLALSSLKSQHAQEIKSGELKVIVQLAIEKSPELPGVAHIYDYAKDEQTREVFDLVFGRQVIGRPISAPPGINDDRKGALRAAFMETVRDSAFLMDAEKMKLDVTPSDGEGIEKLFARFFSYPKDAVDKAAEAMRE